MAGIIVTRCSSGHFNFLGHILRQSSLKNLGDNAGGICRRRLFSHSGAKYHWHPESRSQLLKPNRRRMSSSYEDPSSKLHRPSNFDKKILVWNGCYPSVDQVPDAVSYAQMHRAKDWFRIRANLCMVAATVLACIAVMISGKRAMKRGESVVKQNREFHEAYQKSISNK